MKRKNEPKPRRGRPERLDEAALAKIEELALAGLSPLQMASVLKCSRKAIETFLDSHKVLKAKVQSYRENNSALAKLTLHSLLESGDPETSKWYLQYKAKQEVDKVRIALLRAQRRALEPSKEDLPAGLPSVYWEKVNRYFSSQYENKPEQEQSEAEASDKDGDQTDKTDD